MDCIYILWLIIRMMVGGARGTGEDAREWGWMRNARGGLWYRLEIATGTEEDLRHRLKNPVS